jgi:hypothetical protein
MTDSLRMRQIHLDYHTAGQIGDVGADWDAQTFVETLQRAHVNSITLFARCHHGYVYYTPTRFTQHPSLAFDLLSAQVEACHAAGIRAPIYVTVGWDELAAREHPEWQEVTPQGVLGQHSPLEARWKKLCLNSPYLDYVWAQTEEVIDLFGGEVDGFFFDIIHQGECVCPHCIRGMSEGGLRPDSAADRQRFALRVLDRYRRRFAERVWARVPGCTIFHNAGHIHASLRATRDTFSHFELESLPSTGMWGYNHFPITVRYARTLGKPLLGMTGKFHTSWGDFSSFKNLPALEYECFQMLANGAACSIGDQLHPRGALSAPVYDLIGQVYASVEAKEPWCQGTVAQTEIALFNVEAVQAEDGRVDTAHSGALRMLLEGHHQFDLVDAETDWSSYRVLILPDKAPLDDHLAAKTRAYLRGGGKVIASYRAGMRPDGAGFALDEFGVAYVGPSPFNPDYLWAHAELGAGLPDVEHVIYELGIQTRALSGTVALADTHGPYFNRSWAHFCSHRQTPPDLPAGSRFPAITRNAAGNVIYFANPIFGGYRKQAVLWYKKLFLAALRSLLPDPLVICEAPSTAQVSVMAQPAFGRTVVHLLHYIPERRGLEFDTIEDVIPLYNVPLRFKAAHQPQRVYLAPSGQALPFGYKGGYVIVTVPEVRGHQIVVAERGEPQEVTHANCDC